jgi:hypothetical protein
MLITFQSFANYPVVEGGGVNQWETSKPYNTGTIVWDNFDFYRVLLPHTSTVLATDRAAGDIQKMVDPNDYLVGLTSNIQDQFDVHTTNIGTNATDIGDNVTAIGINASNITTNATDIGDNVTAIGINASNISTNTTDIGTNATNIGTNATNIGLNTTAIGNNATNIGTNATNIGTNTTAIGLNTNHRTTVVGNPHAVTKAEVGLGNVDNTSDANKPISTATQTALDLKADQDLNNLTTTSVNVDLIPSANQAKDLGTPSLAWRDAYVALKVSVGPETEPMNLRAGYPSPSGATVNGVELITEFSSRELALTTQSKFTTVDSERILLETGNSVNGNSGDIEFRTGVPTGTGARGDIEVFATSLDMNATNIVGVADPILAKDAANKDYVDANSGSGTGINILENSGFESGVDSGWTYTAGKVTELSSGTQLNRKKSARFDPALVGEFIVSADYTLQDDLIGTSCQASIYYTGGDEFLSFRVIDDDLNVLASAPLVAHGSANYETIFFLCPNAAKIAGSANTGIIQLEVYQNSATDAAAIQLDLMYLGSLRGLIETASPDVCSARIQNNGVASIISQSGDCIDSVSRTAAGKVLITYKTGYYTLAPVVVGSTNSSDSYVGVLNSTSSSVEINTQNHLQTISYQIGDRNFEVTFTKQGADAKQRIQLYKPFPKTVDLENTLSVKIAGNVTISEGATGIDWVNGNPTAASPSVLTFNAGVFTVVPVCTISVTGNTGVISAILNTVTTTNLSYYGVLNHANLGGLVNAANVEIDCEKQGADRKEVTEIPQIVGQVRNSAAEANLRNVTIEACIINNNGTASIDTASTLCESWVQSVVWSALGQTSLTLKSGAFSVVPLCWANAGDSTYQGTATGQSTTIVTTVTRATAAGGLADTPITVICLGVKQ